MAAARIWFLLFVGLLLVGCGAARTGAGNPALCVTPLPGQTPLVCLPMAPGETFVVHYYHSVENAPIWETHSLGPDGEIYIEEERYEKFGAGMGKMPGVGRMVRRNGYEVITDMHYPVGDFILRVGSARVAHTLIWRGQRRNLSRFHAHRPLLFSGVPAGEVPPASLRPAAFFSQDPELFRGDR